MKRFFQPVEKDGSLKKPALSSSSSSSPPCPPNETTEAIKDGEEGVEKKGPLKFLTWNANSLLLRIKNDRAKFSSFVQNLDPDVICIQEVRMPAAGSKGAPKNPSELKDDTSSSREEKQVVLRALSSLPFKDYRVWWSLSESKYAGTALFIKKQFQPKKVSFSLDRTEHCGISMLEIDDLISSRMRIGFLCGEIFSRCYLHLLSSASYGVMVSQSPCHDFVICTSKHEQDGRVIIAEFESYLLLNTYAPNNGWKEEESSFQRRRKWDKRILDFVQHVEKPLIWCGDLNVSHRDIDVSHPEFFSSAKLNGYTPPNKEDCGQPGFTLAERCRFSNILSQGKLIDAYRLLHKEKDMEHGFSWSGNPIGKYRGKRMRIDYFIVSELLKDRIVSCEMHGCGIELEGFYGSDHCPVSLELSKEA